MGYLPSTSLTYFTGAGVTLISGQTFMPTGEGLLVGRRTSATLRVASSQVAPRHARIWREPDGELVIEDLGSTNGTTVNGARIGRVVLHPGDRVRFACGFDFDVVDLDLALVGHPARP